LWHFCNISETFQIRETERSGGSYEVTGSSWELKAMFKNLVEPWEQYIAKVGQTWARDDPRRELNVEVVTRIQLDIVLEYLNKAMIRAAKEETLLFTETFYHFAWRLMVVLNSSKFSFEGFSKLKPRAEGIRYVRNLLIQHPEKHETKILRPSFTMAAMTGPVLKPVRLGPDTVDAIYDRGLFANAQALHDEILQILRTKLGK
jgi:hypothetical protein